jgi:hypothetical protein
MHVTVHVFCVSVCACVGICMHVCVYKHVPMDVGSNSACYLPAYMCMCVCVKCPYMCAACLILLVPLSTE